MKSTVVSHKACFATQPCSHLNNESVETEKSAKIRLGNHGARAKTIFGWTFTCPNYSISFTISCEIARSSSIDCRLKRRNIHLQNNVVFNLDTVETFFSWDFKMFARIICIINAASRAQKLAVSTKGYCFSVSAIAPSSKTHRQNRSKLNHGA